MGWYDISTKAVLYGPDGQEVARESRIYGGPLKLFAMVRDNLLRIAGIANARDAYGYTIRWSSNWNSDWVDVESSDPVSLDPTKMFDLGDQVVCHVRTTKYVGVIRSIDGFEVIYMDDKGGIRQADYTLLEKNK